MATKRTSTCKTRSARPMETCVPLHVGVNASREGFARRILIFLCMYVHIVYLILQGSLASGQRNLHCMHARVRGVFSRTLSAPQPQHSAAPNSFSPFAPHNARGIAAAATALHCTALHCIALRPRTAVAICKSLSVRDQRKHRSRPGCLWVACAVRPPITSSSAFVEFLAVVATPQRV